MTLRVGHVARAQRRVVTVEELHRHSVIAHYSIPAFDELGGPRLESPPDIASDKLRVAAGDVLISKLNPRKSRVQIVREHDVPAVASTEFVVLRPAHIRTRYLAHLLRSENARQQLDAATQSVTRSQQRVEPRDVLHLPVPVAEPSMQGRIADFLDLEVDRIDRLVSTAAELRRRFDEAPLAFFAERTADLSTTRVGYHYEVQLGKMLDEGRNQSGDLVPYLRNQNVSWDEFDLSDVKEMRLTREEQVRFELRPGDLLACEGRHVGKSAIWDGAIAPMYYQKALHRVRPRRRASTRFLMWCLWLGNFRGDYYADSTGSTIPHLPAEKLRALRMPHASPDEQRQIVAEVDRVADECRRGVTLLDALRERLTEYRNALVSEAVVGSLPATAVGEGMARSVGTEVLT